MSEDDEPLVTFGSGDVAADLGLNADARARWEIIRALVFAVEAAGVSQSDFALEHGEAATFFVDIGGGYNVGLHHLIELYDDAASRAGWLRTHDIIRRYATAAKAGEFLPEMYDAQWNGYERRTARLIEVAGIAQTDIDLHLATFHLVPKRLPERWQQAYARMASVMSLALSRHGVAPDDPKISSAMSSVHHYMEWIFDYDFDE